jgi:hypothetical protein
MDPQEEQKSNNNDISQPMLSETGEYSDDDQSNYGQSQTQIASPSGLIVEPPE